MPLVWTSAPLPPIETFGIAPTGLVRRIRLANGRLIETAMGRRPRRPGETLDQWADRAWLTRRTVPKADDRRTPVRVFDLYAGCGGFSLGLAEACRATARRFVPIAALDVD